MHSDRLLLAETLIAVLDTGGFTTAAARLRVSQSTVSRRIAALERRLGGKPLLTRNAKWIAPTEAALTYMRDVRAVLAQLDAADAAAQETGGEPAGPLRLSLPPALSRARLIKPLSELQKRHPRLRLSLNHSEQYVDLRDGAFDLLVRIRPLEQTGIEQTLLARSPLIGCASRAYAEEHGVPKSLSELQAHSVISVSNRDSVAAALTDNRLRAALGEITPTIETNDVEAALELVRLGHGVGVLPHYLAEKDIASGRLVSVLDGLDAEPLSVFALYPRSMRDSPRIKAVLETLKTALS